MHPAHHPTGDHEEPARPALTLTPGRHPHEIAAFAVAVLVGAPGALLVEPRSNAIRDMLDGLGWGWGWTLPVFYAAWAAWGVVGAVALCLSDQEDRLRFERAACYGCGYSSLGYAIAALVSTGWPAWTAAIGVGLTSPACAWRIRQTHCDLKALADAHHDPQPADPPPLARPVEPSR